MSACAATVSVIIGTLSSAAAFEGVRPGCLLWATL